MNAQTVVLEPTTSTRRKDPGAPGRMSSDDHHSDPQFGIGSEIGTTSLLQSLVDDRELRRDCTG